MALLRERTLYLSGATNMLDHPDLSDPATLRPLLRAFEDKARLIDLLSQMAEERGVQVMIGSENPVEDMRECSLIASTYTYRDQVLGVLGVVGPRRMAYSDVIVHRGRDRAAGLELAVARPAAALPAVVPGASAEERAAPPGHARRWCSDLDDRPRGLDFRTTVPRELPPPRRLAARDPSRAGFAR